MFSHRPSGPHFYMSLSWLLISISFTR